ncbi:pyridoxamine 5'-phosphate oxidase family protein [Streptomyces rubradiris]|uniref:pyridoxamine 5'-phosphate oxidase family protein n=1 Tax=Streptomyces rubradiris TaxID=285531 RepID=UPI0033FCC6DD
MSGFYHEGALELQRRLDTHELAAHIAKRYVTDELDDGAVALITDADSFFLATADALGRPDCSYKGGRPGFVQVLDRRTLAFPSYDGNGMFRSLGNVLVNSAVGLLFIDYERAVKLRVNGDATVSTRQVDLSAFEGADAVVNIRVREVFENCPRYLHDRKTGEYSRHCPRPGYVPPDPAWKRKPEYDGIVRRTDVR